MLNSDKVKLLMLEELENIRSQKPSFSMRAYAKKIGVNQSAISEILANKRPLTRKTAEKILIGLDKSPFEITQILDGEIENKKLYKPLDMDTYHLIADWYYYGILSLAETDDFQSDPQWIAQRLGIPLRVATEAIERLIKLNLLKKDPKGEKLTLTYIQHEAMSDVAVPALKKACRQNIELAQRKLEETFYNERDFTAMTLCFDPDRMDEAKKLIKKFRREFARIMESKKKKEVYKLSVQLFPLTRKNLV